MPSSSIASASNPRWQTAAGGVAPSLSPSARTSASGGAAAVSRLTAAAASMRGCHSASADWTLVTPSASAS
eukprot:6633092-Prymnesium_polylepis.1